jgi:hypothetical protein
MKKITFITMFLFSLNALSQIKVFKGDIFNNNVVMTYHNSKIYKGNSVANKDVLATFSQGKIYRGSSVANKDVLATFSQGKIYRGNSVANKDILFYINGSLSSDEFVFIWYTNKYLF